MDTNNLETAVDGLKRQIKNGQLTLSSSDQASILALARLLKSDDAVTSLIIKDKDFSAAMIDVLKYALKGSKTLTTLTFGGGLRADGAAALAGVLMENTSLKDLNLYGNKIEAAGATAIATALIVNRTLNELDVKYNDIGLKGLLAFTEVLKTNKSITAIDIVDDGFGREGVSAVAQMLRTNTTLKSLTLGGNKGGLNTEGVGLLSDALVANTTLEKLNLMAAGLDEKDSLHIARAMQGNRGLTHLNIANSRPGPTGTKAIADALKVNTSLLVLGLDCSDIGSIIGARAFAEALKTNTTLSKLTLDTTYIGGNAGAEILASEITAGRVKGKPREFLPRNDADVRHYDYTGKTTALSRFFGACAHEHLLPVREATQKDYAGVVHYNQSNWGWQEAGYKAELWKCCAVEMCKDCGKVGKLMVDHRFDPNNPQKTSITYAGSDAGGPNDGDTVIYAIQECTRCGGRRITEKLETLEN